LIGIAQGKLSKAEMIEDEANGFASEFLLPNYLSGK
jgi:Zn-dependent peptidase ImmA (M78 family)